MYQPKMIAVEIRCLACHKDFYVKVDHPGKVMPAWQFYDHCQPCAANGGKKPSAKDVRAAALTGADAAKMIVAMVQKQEVARGTR